MRIILLIPLMSILAAPCFSAQGNTAAGLAGVGAGAALGAGAGQAGATTPGTAGGAGGAGGAASSAPIEVQIMAYQGLSDLAADIAGATETKLCGKRTDPKTGTCITQRAVLLEDPTSALQIALYQSLLGYHDQLQTLHGNLAQIFSLSVSPQTLAFGAPATPKSLTFKIANTGSLPLSGVTISFKGPNAENFKIEGSGQCAPIPPNASCNVAVEYTPPTDVDHKVELNAWLEISLGNYASNQTVMLSATYTPPPPKKPAAAPSGLVRPETRLAALERVPEIHFEAVAGAGTPAAPAAAAAAPAASAAAATPESLTYLSAIGTALTGIKSGITYSSSSVQPTTQAFELLIENELQKRNIAGYTSTSPLDLAQATTALSTMFGDMLVMGADLDYWTTMCKPQTSDADKAPKKPVPPLSPECTSPVVTTSMAAAQQMITGYATLLQNSSDGSGSPVIADVLRGWMLLNRLKLDGSLYSLQVTVAGAAGSTRTNAFFLVNLFYLPKPSYNAGVIVTFELRDGQNDLMQSGVRTAFFDYNKNWKGTNFDNTAIKDGSSCDEKDTFCVHRK